MKSLISNCAPYHDHLNFLMRDNKLKKNKSKGRKKEAKN